MSDFILSFSPKSSTHRTSHSIFDLEDKRGVNGTGKTLTSLNISGALRTNSHKLESLFLKIQTNIDLPSSLHVAHFGGGVCVCWSEVEEVTSEGYTAATSRR